MSIGVIGVDGSDQGGISTQNTTYDTGAWYFTWSPDSTQLAFLDDQQGSTGNIVLSVASPTSGAPHQLNNDTDFGYPAWRPATPSL
jgi:hypothetical protein